MMGNLRKEYVGIQETKNLAECEIFGNFAK